MSSDLVVVEVADQVAVITMNRPEARNALNPELLDGVPAALAELDARDDVAVMVLTGADPAFCAGLDLKALSSDAGMQSAIVPPADQRGPFPNLRKPLIGAINGPAVTGGFEYALACDLLIASERARFADTHARVGIMPGWGLSVNLAEAIGLRRARQLSFTGNYLDAETALAWGLVNEVVPHERLIPRTLELAADMASIETTSVQGIKRTYREGGMGTYDTWWDREKELSNAWMKGFDPDDLAARRESIQARGSSQASG